MVGERIKEYLQNNGITQAFVARETGLKPCTLSDIFNRGRRVDVTEYYKICKALNVPLDKFLED